MSGNEIVPCYRSEEVCKQIERNLDVYMRLEDWDRTKSDIWAFWRTLLTFIICENETPILEEMYDSYMSEFNKVKVSKKDFVAYMTRYID